MVIYFKTKDYINLDSSTSKKGKSTVIVRRTLTSNGGKLFEALLRLINIKLISSQRKISSEENLNGGTLLSKISKILVPEMMLMKYLKGLILSLVVNHFILNL